MDDSANGTLARIEARQIAHETVMRTILEVLQIQGEKLDAVLQAATIEPGPSPVAEALQQILATLTQQTALLAELPNAIVEIVREDLADDVEPPDLEPAEGAFEREAGDAP